jgi:hypothetical protein
MLLPPQNTLFVSATLALSIHPPTRLAPRRAFCPNHDDIHDIGPCQRRGGWILRGGGCQRLRHVRLQLHGRWNGKRGRVAGCVHHGQGRCGRRLRVAGRRGWHTRLLHDDGLLLTGDGDVCGAERRRWAGRDLRQGWCDQGWMSLSKARQGMTSQGGRNMCSPNQERTSVPKPHA